MYPHGLVGLQYMRSLEMINVQVGAQIIGSAKVLDPETGYIYCKAVNHVVTERTATGNCCKQESWYDARNKSVHISGVESFTKGQFYTHNLNQLSPGDQVIVADDFCASGHTTRAFYEGLTQFGIKPVFVFLAVKDSKSFNPPQTGYRQLKEADVPLFSVVRFTDIKNGRAFGTISDL